LAPSVSSSHSSTSWSSDTTPTFTFSASDISGVVAYRWSMDGSSGTDPTDGTVTSTGSAAPSSQPDGERWFHVQAQNGSGLWGTTAHYKVRIDSSAPPVPSVTSSHSSTSWSSDTTPTFTFSSSDISGIAQYRWSIDASSGTVPTSGNLTSSGSATTEPQSDGEWWFHVQAQNGSGLWGNPAHYKVRIDSSAPPAPSVSSSHSSTSWSSDTTPTFTFSASDLSGVVAYRWSMDGSSSTVPTSGTVTTTGSTAPSSQPDGERWFHVQAQNGSGLWGTTAHYKVLIDSSVPAAPVVGSPTHNDSTGWYPQRQVTFTWTASDTAPVTEFSWTLDQSPSTLPDTTVDTDTDGDAFATTLTVADDGVWWLHVRARNAAGLWSTDAGHFKVQIDASAPAISVLGSSSHPDQDTWYPDDDPVASWGATSTSPIVGYTWDLDQVADTALAQQVRDAQTTFQWTDRADGVWWLHVRAYNEAGVWSGTEHFRVQIDDTPAPLVVTSATHPDPDVWYPADDLELVWATSDTSGIDGYSWVLNHTATTVPDDTFDTPATANSWDDLADGTWWFHVKVRNGAGLWTVAHRRILIDDTPAPLSVTSSTHPSTSTWYAADDVSLEWGTSDTSGIDGYSWELNHTATTVPDDTFDTPATANSWDDLADGTWWFHVKVRNGAGLWTTVHRRVLIDDTNPALGVVSSSTHPNPNVWYASDDGSLSWVYDDTAPIDGYSFVVDQSSATVPNTVSQGTATSTTFANLTDGTWWLHVRARNAAGLWSDTTHFRIRIDDTKPAVPALDSATHPTDAWSTNDDPAFAWSASDTAPIDGYSWVLDNSATTVPDITSEGTSTSRAFSGVADGTWYFHVRARNAAGLWSNAAHHKVRIDDTAPAISTLSSSTHPSTSTWYAKNDPKLAWTASDTSGINGYSWVLDKSSSTTPNTTSQGTAVSNTFTDVADGTWWFHVKARNGAGLWGPAKHYQLNIDVTPPAVTLGSTTHPDQFAWYVNDDPRMTWNATDTHSGVLGVDYQLDRFAGTKLKGPNVTTSASGAKTYSNVADGQFWFHGSAIDRAGNRSQTVHRGVQVVPPCSGNSQITIDQPAGVALTSRRYTIAGVVPQSYVRLSVYRDSNGNGVYDTGDVLVTSTSLPHQAVAFDLEVPLDPGPNCLFLTVTDLAAGSTTTWGPSAVPVLFAPVDQATAGESTHSPDGPDDDTYDPSRPPVPRADHVELQLVDHTLDANLLPGVADASRIFPGAADPYLLAWWEVSVLEEDLERAVAAFEELPAVQYAQLGSPSVVHQAGSPNDYDANLQNELEQIRVAGGWTASGGAGATQIAIVDSGVRFPTGATSSTFHPDLLGTYSQEYDCVSEATSDRNGNGQIDPSDHCPAGVQAFYGTHGPDDEDATDHGTFVGGIAAANTDNGIGVASVGHDTRFVSYRTHNSSGRCGREYDDQARRLKGIECRARDAFRLAADHRQAGTHDIGVINASFGAPRRTVDKAYEQAVNYAGRRGIAVVASAGNVSGDKEAYDACVQLNSDQPDPAAYCVGQTKYQPSGWSHYPSDSHGAVAVGALQSDPYADAPATWGDERSNMGTFVDIAAPCTNFYTTWRDFDIDADQPQAFDYRDSACGTSGAAPQVSAAVALLTTRVPPLRAVHRVLSAAARYTPPKLHGALGRGRLDVTAAFENLAVRLGGPSRIDTSVRVSRETYPGNRALTLGSWLPRAVVLARADDSPTGGHGFADSLSAAGLAGTLDAPVLLVSARDLARWPSYDSQTRNEIERLLGCSSRTAANDPNRGRAGLVWIVGGSAAIPDGNHGAEARLADCFEPGQLVRIQGPDRYSTAVEVARQIVKRGNTDYFKIGIASGTRFADATVLSAWTARHKSPLLLVPGAETGGDLPLSVRQFLQDYAVQITDVYIAGGTAAVSAAVEAQIVDTLSGGPADVHRLAGPDRYATATTVASTLFPTASGVVLAQGDNWPDGVTGGVLAHPALSGVGRPLLLTRAAGYDLNLRRETANYLRDRPGIRSAYLLGLDAAISPTVQAQVEGCLRENAGRQSTSYCDP